MSKSPRATTKIDQLVATRLRAARLECGLTQDQAATELGISFQQIQKYEKGTNRVSASRLFVMAGLYGKTLDWFFSGVVAANGKKPTEDIAAKLLASPHGVDIARHYLALPGHSTRRLVIDVAEALVGRAS